MQVVYVAANVWGGYTGAGQGLGIWQLPDRAAGQARPHDRAYGSGVRRWRGLQRGDAQRR